MPILRMYKIREQKKSEKNKIQTFLLHVVIRRGGVIQAPLMLHNVLYFTFIYGYDSSIGRHRAQKKKTLSKIYIYVTNL